MIEVNELRIGNFIKVDDLPIEQVTLETFATLLRFPATLSCFNAVPLSEEWLLKFGFKKIVWEESIRYEKDYKTVKYYSWNETFQWQSNDGFDEVKLEFVHELQNLFFAMMGEELILNN